MMVLFLIGPSACGKGTQAGLLSERYNLEHISVGDLLRSEVDRKTEIGLEVEPVLKAGHFVEGNIIYKLLHEKTEKLFDEGKGIIIDGFPRLYSQAEASEKFIRHGVYFKVILYSLDMEECKRRLENRFSTGGQRADDNVLTEREKSFFQDIDRIKKYYSLRGQMLEINAKPSIEDIFLQTTMLIDNDMIKENIFYNE